MVLSGTHDCACGRSYVYFSFWPEESGPRNVDALLLRGRLGNPCDTQQHQPQRSTKTPSGGPQFSRGLGARGPYLLTSCFAHYVLWFYVYVNSSVLLWFFFTLEASFSPQNVSSCSVFWKFFCFIVFVGGGRGAAVRLKMLNLFWWRDIPPSASILPLACQDVM